MKLKTLFLFGFLVVLGFYSCEDTGPMPIDVHDPTDSTSIDTSWKALIREVEGVYRGTCYSREGFPPHVFLDTIYNATIVLDSIDRVMSYGQYVYTFNESDSFYIFHIPEKEFVRDTVYMSAIGLSQKYSRSYRVIRSERSLYAKWGYYPGNGGYETKCYCTKQ